MGPLFTFCKNTMRFHWTWRLWKEGGYVSLDLTKKPFSSEHSIQVIIMSEIEGRSSTLLGYRGWCEKLRATYHVTVPRDVVMKMCQSTRNQMHMRFLRTESCNVTSHQRGKRNAACRWLRQVEAVWLTWFMAISMDSLGELYSLKYVKATTTQYPSKFFPPYGKRQ